MTAASDMFPPDFVRRLKEAVGSEAEAVLGALKGEPPVSVRFNPYKGAPGEGRPVPWEPLGRYLPQRPSFTADPLFHAGAYYVQEASSMFAGELCRRALEYLSGGVPSRGGATVRILDLCAAPGGKTTHYSVLAGPDGLVVANETVRPRAAVLADNVRRWGLGNVLVTAADPSRFGALPGFFDIVAVDAPCSGEGMFRKNSEAVREWSPQAVEACASRQRRILADAWETLRPGGVLIYSTCTFNRTENEDNIAWLEETFGAGPATFPPPAQWGIFATESAGIPCYRFLPHLTEGEGFFAAAVLKPEGPAAPLARLSRNPLADASAAERTILAQPLKDPGGKRFVRAGEDFYFYTESVLNDVRQVSGSLPAVYGGVCAGRLYSGVLKPDHPLAMYPGLDKDAYPAAVLTEAEAVAYLRRAEPSAAAFLPEGLNLVTYEGLPLGWAKRVGRRVNNLYPKSMMILNRAADAR